MRSKVFTLVLAFLALTCGALAFIRLTQNDLSALFGAPPRPASQALLKFSPSDIRGITISSKGKTQSYQERSGQWIFLSKTSPEDRADYRVLEALLACTSELIVTESFPASQENLETMGLVPAQAHFKLKNEKGEIRADFAIGKKAAWHLHIPAPDQQTPAQDWPAVYVRPKDSKYIYLCSSPFLDDILANGFEPQRDLRPFFFPPELLGEVTISRETGNIVLAREAPHLPWRITKPFSLDTNPKAISELIGGLYKLTAKTAINKPAPQGEDPSLGLSLRFFTRRGLTEEAVTLHLTEPAAADETLFLGRLNDWRKDIEFTIPRVPTAGYVDIDSLPLSLDALRGTSLSGLNLTLLKRLRIQGPELDGPLDVFIEKSPITKEWRAQRSYQGQTSTASEETYFEVKKALTEGKAIRTVSDAADDFSLYGLSHPALTVTTELFPQKGEPSQQETIHFGIKSDSEGIPHYYFRRDNSRIVMEVASETFFSIAAQPYLWRASSAWSFNLIDLNFLRIEKPNAEPLTLEYNDISQSWAARTEERDVTGLLNENRANRYIENLEALAVTRWLGPNHRGSQLALQKPIFTLTAVFKRPDDENAPITTQTLKLARSSQSGSNRFYFGQVEGDPQTFILDLTTVGKLAVDLLEEE